MKLSLQEKIGQLYQGDLSSMAKVEDLSEEIKQSIRKGQVGSFLNVATVDIVNEIQRIAVEEGNGIPLLIARDVIHGYRTIFPIPLGQAATWNPAIVKSGARIAAVEASANGIRWTFAPMIDISRDPRWGRIAESFGEDPYLTSLLATASVEGYQGDDLSDDRSIAACAKHFLGYGAAEGGRDYNTTYIPEPLLHNVYLPPYQAAVDAGVASVMTAFNDLNGIPVSTNKPILDGILRNELGFQGVVVSDWASIVEAIVHGSSSDEKDAALKAIQAGVDMEMHSRSYHDNIATLLDAGSITVKDLDAMVDRVLTMKEKLGLFGNPYTDPARQSEVLSKSHLDAAKISAQKSLVLLKNEKQSLPINKSERIALIGPLAHAAHDQLGTWVFDGKKEDAVTILDALSDRVGDQNLSYAAGLEHSRSSDESQFTEAIEIAKGADKIIFVGGEESALSGEAHSRADIRLPGAQEKLLRELSVLGKPVVLIIMAGRQIALNDILNQIDGLIMAWHPGTMGGEAITGVILGDVSPSGKLPVTWPKVTGQVPLYYNCKNTGRPANSIPFTLMEDFPVEASQCSLGNASHYIDVGFEPQFPFGFGLSYTKFEYEDRGVLVNNAEKSIKIAVLIKNIGKYSAIETVQLYIQDEKACVTRPVKELKAFLQIELAPNEEKIINFELSKEQLMFFDQNVEKVFEPGQFKIWVGPDSQSGVERQITL